MKLARIQKIYASRFLLGLIFWYGIEKLFMGSIGIDAVGIGTATAVFIAFTLIFDIPSGILADKWSRKGMLLVSAAALVICSLLMAISHGLVLYAIAEIFYGIYIVGTSGTYSAITYDILHEENRTADYSKVAGRSFALFLAGAGIANIASGFVAHQFSYQATYFISVIPCLLSVFVLLTLKEPTFHKLEQKEKILKQLSATVKTIGSIQLVRGLVVILSVLAVAELFKSEFSQLYMLRYVSSVQLLGILWAAYAFAWSLGSLVAHRFKNKLTVLICCAVVPYIAMSFIDNWFSLVLFMFQAVASEALINQIETHVQDSTPSSVRASVLSVASTLGRLVSLPASFVIGWLIRDFNALWALRFVAILLSFVLIYWLSLRRRLEARP